MPQLLLFVALAFAATAHAQVSTTLNPVYHGELALRPAVGTMDPDTGAGVLRVRGWQLRLTADSNGIFPDREPLLVALSEDVFRIEAGELRADRRGTRFRYRAPKGRPRGVEALRMMRRRDGTFDVRLTLVGLSFARLLFEDPVCYPMAVVVGDDDGFAGVSVSRQAGRSRRIAIARGCTPDTNWVWLERCGIDAPPGVPC